MSDEIQTRPLIEGEPLRELVMTMVNAMHEAAAPLIMQVADPRDGISALMTAASMFAGAQFGTLSVMGAVKQQDTRRAVEAAGRNFREGIKVGSSKALRAVDDQWGSA